MLTRPQLAGWQAWLVRRPRGDRHTEVVLANQTAHLFSAWVDGEHDPSRFLVQWKEAEKAEGPQSEADQLFDNIGMSQRMAGLDAG